MPVNDFYENLDKLSERTEDEERYKLTPKGVLLSVFLDLSLAEDVDDRQFMLVWELFETRLKKQGFVILDKDWIEPVDIKK